VSLRFPRIGAGAAVALARTASTTARRFLAAATAPVLLGACGIFRPPLQPPEEGGDAWTRLTSEHFVLYTDVDPTEARAEIERFETLRFALQEVAFPPSGERERRVSVVLFRQPSDYQVVGPPSTSGFFTARLPIDVERQPTLVVAGDWSEVVHRRFVHEMVHELMHRAFGETPSWLNEGLADYFSTLHLKGNLVVLGAPVPERASIPILELPTVSEITHSSRREFSTNQSYEGTVARYYAGAWLLVHLLRNGPEAYRQRFDAFARALAEGTHAAEAWRLAMRGLTDSNIQSDFEAHATAWEWAQFGRTIEVPKWPVPETVTMRAAEVHLLWARIAPSNADGRTLAAAQLRKAAALEPASAEVAYVGGGLSRATDHLAEAADAFRHAAALAPQDPRFAFALGSTLLEQPFGATTHGRELGRVGHSLEETATSPEQEAFVAEYLMTARREDDALDRARHAVRADERCGLCAQVLAHVLADRGDREGAVAVLERALSASLDEPQDRFLLESAAKYRSPPAEVDGGAPASPHP
jgi:tetratricopeptide (TPR) repeat protein